MSLQDLLVAVGGAPLVSAADLAAITAPTDGQEVVLQAETSPNTLWRLRWNDGSAEPYQWEFMGGPPMFTMYDTADTFDNTPHDAWRAGAGLPQLFMPRPGVYHVSFGAYIGAPPSGTSAKVGIGLDGADPLTVNAAVQYNNFIASVSQENDMEVSGSLRMRMAYWRGDSAGNDLNVGRRWIAAVPLRMS